ncbi:MAG: hypothetical protein J5554_04125, partial [Paludibacteraceae bacterium]|nr:hypothetical protein [Paludibacteraceae bacterium]
MVRLILMIFLCIDLVFCIFADYIVNRKTSSIDNFCFLGVHIGWMGQSDLDKNMVRLLKLYFVVIGLVCLPCVMANSLENSAFRKSQLMEKSKSGKLEAPTATLEVGEGVMKENLEISLSSIAESQLPKLDRGMTNVTDSFSGYRFLPHGEHFSGKGAKVVLGYDRTK